MSQFLDNIKRFFRREATSATTESGTQYYTPRAGGGVSVLSFPGCSDAMAIAATYRCVTLLSESVASLRLQYMQRKGGRYQEDIESDFHYLLTVQPQPEMSAFSFWSMAVQLMLLEGNAYIYPRYVMGELTDLVLCHPKSVSQDPLTNRYFVSDAFNGVYGTFEEKDIIHLYLHTADGRRGESVIAHARRTMDIASAADEETENRFVNGGSVRGIISNDKTTTGFGEYQDKELERTAESVDSRFSRGERIVSVPGQVDFKQISLSSTDMQFLESRKFTVREICRFFGVHPSFVFDDTSSNYKSAEMANVAFLSNTLDPILKRIECELTRKLIPREMCCKRKFQFDRRGIYSMDLQSLADYQKKTIESGIYTVNDWRRIENQPTIDGGDTVYISTNLMPLGEKTTQAGSGTDNNKNEGE